MAEILDSDILLRRVNFLHPANIKDDGSPSSMAFTPRKQDHDGLSVDVEKLTTIDDAIVDRQKYRLFALAAKIPREVDLECVHDPLEGNSAHGLISGNFTRSKSRKLAKNAIRVG